MTDRRSEEPFELGHDAAFDVSADFGERPQDVQPYCWRGISERYVAGEVEVHLHFRFGKPEAADFCAVYERATKVEGDLVPDEAWVHDEGLARSPLAPTERHLGVRPAHHAQTLVPVQSGKLIEDPEFVVPSLVRLQLLDGCSCFRVHRPNLVHPATVVVPTETFPVGLDEGLFLTTDGKPDGSLGGFAGRLGSESPSEVVQGASHVLKGVPDDGAEVRGRLPDNFRVEDVLAAIRVGFVDDSIWFSGHEGTEFVAENFQVFACPKQFEASPGE